MELIVIRHALPLRVEQADGAADPGLSEAGVAQAEHMAQYLATERIDALFSSPMRRAVQTAAPLAEATGLAPTIVDDVAEWDRHASSYIPAEELKASGAENWIEQLNGDNMGDDAVADFHRRVIAALETIVEQHRGQTVAVVCHGGVINAYIAHVMGLPLTLPGALYPNYTSIHRFAAASSGERSVLALNETAHLRGTGLPVGLFQKG